jgi:riboflavin kinase / FMN adenylyltransferase
VKLFRSLNDFPSRFRGGAVAIGNFDGVHHGHRSIVEALNRHATNVNGPTIVFTFDPHPVRLLRPESSPPPLTWTDRKADLLAEIGIDAMIAYPTDRELLELSYGDFFQLIVVERLAAKAMVEGPNFFFGHNREGNVERLAELCRERSIALEIVSPNSMGNELVSSSRIRKLIQDGEVGLAREMLTQPYRIRGIVVHGDARGGKLGFPTANLDGIDTLVPKFGVYAGRALLNHRWHWSAIHIGPSPTFGQKLPRVEAHILNFEGSLYGRTIEIDFIERLRDISSFSSPQELQHQLLQDVEATRVIAREFLQSHREHHE